MSDPKELMKRLDQAAAPDIWADAMSRSAHRVPEPEHGRARNGSRIAAATFALVVSLATITILVATFAPIGPGKPDVPGPPSGPALGSFDGWTVSVSIEPTQAESLSFSVGPARASSGHGWVQHSFTVTNVGNRTLYPQDDRTSVFLGPPARSLIAADWRCGYGYASPTSPVSVGACDSSLIAYKLQPGKSLSRDITLYKDLRGMSPLTAGTYVFHQPFTYSIERTAGFKDLILLVTYTIAPAGSGQGTGSPTAVPPRGAFVPRSVHVGSRVNVPVTFPDGTRADVSYPQELGLASFGVRPYASGELRGCCARDFDILRGSFSGLVRGSAPVAEFPGAEGAQVEVWRGRGDPAFYLVFRFGEWNVLVWDGSGGATMTKAQRATWASHLDGTESSDGFLVLHPTAPLELMPSGPGAGGPQLVFGDIGSRALLLWPGNCQPPSGQDVVQFGEVAVDLLNQGAGWSVATWCAPGRSMTAQAYGDDAFIGSAIAGIQIQHMHTAT